MVVRRAVWCALSIIGETTSGHLWFGPWGRATFDEWFAGLPCR
jgi:hypothetical protein